MLPTRVRCCGVIGSCVSRFAKPAASASPSIQTMAPIAAAAMIESVHTFRGPDQRRLAVVQVHALLAAKEAASWAIAFSLHARTLTTYVELPWNGPYYE